jgi:hypothetical protein
LNLLAIAERDPLSDANTVSGLSSYAFTPFLYVTFSPDGGANQMRDRAQAPRPELPPAVSGAFFRVAANILLRPLPPPDQDHTTSGRIGKFMVIRRLLPLFEQYAPERAPELRTQMAAMAADVPQGMQSGENRAITSGITPDNASDPMERMQNRLDRARTSEERDSIYADVAVALAARNDPRARDVVDKIEDTEMRKRVRAYIDFQTIQAAIQERNAAEAVRIAKSGELTGIQRVWAYTRASSLLLPTERAEPWNCWKRPASKPDGSVAVIRSRALLLPWPPVWCLPTVCEHGKRWTKPSAANLQKDLLVKMSGRSPLANQNDGNDDKRAC